MVHNIIMINTRDYPQMKIRLSPELKTMIEDSAENNNRTLNAEICHQLGKAYSQKEPPLTESKLRDVLKELLKPNKS